jgi:hypothetical protein
MTVTAKEQNRNFLPGEMRNEQLQWITEPGRPGDQFAPQTFARDAWNQKAREPVTPSPPQKK